MGLDDIKKKVEAVEDKLPDGVVETVKKAATKENLEKAKDVAEDVIEKGKDLLGKKK